MVEPGGRQRELLGEGGDAQVGAAVPVALHRLPHGGPPGPVQGHAPPGPADAQVLPEAGDALRQDDEVVLGLQEVGGAQPLGQLIAHEGEDLLPHTAPGVGQHPRASLADDPLGDRGDLAPGPLEDHARHPVQATDHDPGLAKPLGEGQPWLELGDLTAQVVGEVARVGRQQDPRLASLGRIPLGELDGAVHRDDGLPGSGAARDAHGAVRAPLHEGPLLGVQEELPLGEAEPLDGAAQVLVGLQPGEGRACRAGAQTGDEVGVGGLGGDVAREPQPEVLTDVLDRRPRGQVEQRLALPGDPGGGGQVEQLGLALRRQCRRSEPDVDAELVAQDLHGEPLGPAGGLVPAGDDDGARHRDGPGGHPSSRPAFAPAALHRWCSSHRDRLSTRCLGGLGTGVGASRGLLVATARLGVGGLDPGGLAGDLVGLALGSGELGPGRAPRLLDGVGIQADEVPDVDDLGDAVAGVDVDRDGLGDLDGLVVRPDAVNDVDDLAVGGELEQDGPVEVGDARGAHAPVPRPTNGLQVQARARGHGGQLADEWPDLRPEGGVLGGGVLRLAAGQQDRGHVSVLPGARG